MAGDPRGAGPHRVGIGLQAHIRDPGASRRIGGDQVGERAPVSGADAQHHVYLFGLPSQELTYAGVAVLHFDDEGQVVEDRRLRQPRGAT